jgi:hypothetical protein
MGETARNTFFYVLVFTGLGVALRKQHDYLGPNIEAFRKGRGKANETPSTLLDRLEWIADYKNRINVMPQVYIISFIISIIVGMVMINRFPSGLRLFYMMLVIFPLMLFGLNFFVYHTDRFVPFHIKKNVEYIRKSLKLKRRKDLETLETCLDNVATHSDVNSLKTY